VDPVLDKAAGNFCEFFTVGEQPPPQPRVAVDARARLEALFKKKP